MIKYTLPTLTANFLVCFRLGPLFIFTPIQAIRQLPIPLRIILLLMLSSLLVINLSLTVNYKNEIELMTAALIEFTNGFCLSMGLYVAFAVFNMAGQLIETQMGLNTNAVFNTTVNSNDPLSCRLLMMLALMYFFSINGHHWFLKGIAYSLRTIPLGCFLFFKDFILLLRQFSLSFSLAFMISSPVIVGLQLIELIAAVLTRNLPQISSYFLSLPIKLMTGLLLLNFSLNSLSPLMDRLFKFCFKTFFNLSFK